MPISPLIAHLYSYVILKSIIGAPGEMMEKCHLKIDVEPKRLLVTSEPYVIFTHRGYQPVIDVVERRSRREYYIFISAISLAASLEKLRLENGERMVGIEFWIRKQGPERTSKYIVEE